MTDDPGRLDGRVALVTGGARGIGLAIAQDLAARGARLVIADNGTGIGGDGADPAVAAQAAQSIGAQARAYSESIASPSTAAAAVGVAVQAFGGLDIVVNCAAIIRDGFIFKSDPADWEAVIRTNLSAPYYLLAAAAPILREQAKANRGGAPYGWGRIVNIVSTAGLYGNFGQSPYASAKAGLVGLTRVAAMDLARSGVTCNAIAPFAATRVTESIKPANEGQAAYKRKALKVSPKHVATVVAWLASPAAQGVTGQLFGVRGRQVMLFAQARPALELTRASDWDVATLARETDATFKPRYVGLETDLEAFSGDPHI